MKIYRFVTAAMMLATCTTTTPAHAYGTTSNASSTADDATQAGVKVCVAMGNLAAEVMRGRQEGHSFAAMYSMAQKSDDQTVRKLHISMVETAFQVSRYQSERYRSEAIQNFRNVWEEECIKVMVTGESTKKGYS